MRISTGQIYNSGALSIQRNQSTLYKLQNQMSSGRRILTPSDDPVAAAQALIVTQAQDINAQHVAIQSSAGSQLALVDSQLSSLKDVLQDVREKIIEAGNAKTLTDADRRSIATELEVRLGEMVGIANSRDTNGDYLFSGYQGATLPFAVNGAAPAVPPATTRPVGYYGDDGERLVQVSDSRQMAVNVAGSDLFMNISDGNGSFVVAPGGNFGGGLNQGTAVSDSGSVLDPQQWQAAVNGFGWTVPANPALQIRFSVAAGATTYQLYDVSGAPTPISAAVSYTAGQTITLASSNPPAATNTDFSAQFVLSGQPADGDTFAVTPSSSQSLFQTMQSLIGVLRTPLVSAAATTQYSNALGGQLTNLDQAFANIGRVQATVGARMNEVDSLTNAASDLDIQYTDILSKLTGLDYAKAISDFTMQQTFLEAAQKSFAQVSGLSLFNYL